jgi:hypothetical protein
MQEDDGQSMFEKRASDASLDPSPATELKDAEQVLKTTLGNEHH